jgi:ABC-type Zn uptake system ZnuABC Zn-binding protein ZnuA
MARRLPVMAVLTTLALAGCGDDGGTGDEAAVRVVATTTQAGDLVRNVGGDRAAVRVMLPAKADPHEFEPRPSDARAVADADVVVRSGGDLDEWLDSVVDNAGGGADVVTLIDSVRRLGDDPHWWQDPRNAELAVASIRDALIDADPEGRAGYERRARLYKERLRSLDGRIAACMRGVPAERRKLVTTHDSLGYFARRYDVEIVGELIPSLSSQAQPSARDLERLVDRIRAEGVEAIFPETALNPKLERAVARDAGVEVDERLWTDSLGPRGSGAATYLDAMAFNARAMAAAMTGEPGACGKLGTPPAA